MIAVIPADKFKKAQALLNRADEKFHVIGRIVKPVVKNDPAQDRKVIYS
jgi:phosphoribosylformylglycinamidine cyclo-ligase